MWRVRPELLEGQGLEKNDVRPVGCERRGPHDFGEVGIAFVDESAGETPKEVPVAVFELPRPSSCQTKAAQKAREAIREALGLLPPSRAVASFERASGVR
jgi:hypothetical protein